MPENMYRRRNKDGTYTWYARVKIRGPDGKVIDHRPSLRTGSKVEARRKLRPILDQAEHVRFFGEERHSWKKAVAEWGPAMAGAVKPSTLERYTISLNECREALENLYVDEVSVKTMAAIVKARRAKGATNATIKRDLTAVSSVLSYCCAQGWREDNPAKAYDRTVVREQRGPVILPAVADIDAVVAAARGTFASLIRFSQYTAMREEEAASLERHQVRGRVVDLTYTKTNRPRAVELDDRAWGTLEGTPVHIGTKFVFWHQKGVELGRKTSEARRHRNVSSRFGHITRKLFRLKKISRRFRFHDLRHWFAVDYLRSGGNIYDLQKHLGHSSIKTTELYLDFLTPEEARRAKYGAHKGHMSDGLRTQTGVETAK